MAPVRLLVTSVGSLLGQNILDMVETRRDQVHLIGTTNEAANPRLYRCDTVYMAPPDVEREAFEARLLDIIRAENPDLIIAARDPDILVQASWRETRPEMVPLLTAGAMRPAMIMQDKLLSYRFAKKRGLPFAETAVCGPNGNLDAIYELGERCGYPLLAKPRGGYGSHGVSLILDQTQIENFRDDFGYVFQQYLDPPEDLVQRLPSLQRGIPLFFSLPESPVFGCQLMVGPDGEVACHSNVLARLVVGRSEYIERIYDPKLDEIGLRYAKALVEIGWVGPLNLQGKRCPDGGYTLIEMNGRLSGGSAARTFMGFDEMSILVDLFLGESRLRPLPTPPRSRRRVIKTLVDGVLDDADVEQLQRASVWRRPTDRSP
jgi:hypothetical protein